MIVLIVLVILIPVIKIGVISLTVGGRVEACLIFIFTIFLNLPLVVATPVLDKLLFRIVVLILCLFLVLLPLDEELGVDSEATGYFPGIVFLGMLIGFQVLRFPA